MYDHILIPVDMAHPEKAADMIKSAQKIAGDNVVFVLANIVHSVPAVAEMAVPQEIFDTACKKSEDKLAELAKEAGIEAAIDVRMGHPANDILEIAKERGVDLIIIGSHRPGLQDYLIGSTASRVVRHAQCPVLIMR